MVGTRILRVERREARRLLALEIMRKLEIEELAESNEISMAGAEIVAGAGGCHYGLGATRPARTAKDVAATSRSPSP